MEEYVARLQKLGQKAPVFSRGMNDLSDVRTMLKSSIAWYSSTEPFKT
jgi:hypothetical protein